jgi:hypothetical protein
MSEYYNAQRSRNLFDPQAKEPFKLSRSKIDLFLSCPRCFYLDRRLGTGRPPGFPFSLNSAVDALLKKEFDIHRVAQSAHPLMTTYGVDAVPFQHEMMNEWRENFKGVQYLHEATNFIITGAVDDVWVNPQGELIIVDYKSTSKDAEITLEEEWKDGYKRQMEVYQWLMRRNGFTVSNTGYFVYANGSTDRAAFDGKLDFEVTLLPYEGDDSWVEDAITRAHECLSADTLPSMGNDCDYCAYFKQRQDHGA